MRCGSGPAAVSDLNYTAGASVAASTLAPLDGAGHVCVTASADAHVVVDLAGFVTAGTFTALPPTRLTDTRTPTV